MSTLLQNKILAIYSLLCALFLIIVGSVHLLAFGLQPSIQTIQQGIPGLGIPGQQQQQEQPTATPPQQQEQPQVSPSQSPSFPPSSSIPPPPLTQSSPVIPEEQQGPNQGIIAHGFIDSLIFTPSATWIATGNWTIGVNNDNAALVSSNMTWYNDNGTSSHTHEILNFRPFGQGEQQQQSILVQPEDNSVSLRGVLDVGANHRISWNDVQSTIDIKKGGKILSISLNHVQTNHHFGGRPIFGIVTSFTRCSDQPGPNMEILPPCLNIPTLPPAPAPQPTVAAAPPSPAISTPVSPPPSGPANNTVPNPATSPPPTLRSTPPLMSNAPGNMTTGRLLPPAVTSNATGKSPFDVIGGG
jgi:hypothetical protein